MNTTHLTTSPKFKHKHNSKYSQILIDKFIECCLKLDASIFEPYMTEDDVFEDKEKYSFLAQTKEMFNEVKSKSLDDFKVEVQNTTCKGCSTGDPVFHFRVATINKIPVDEFAYLIDVKDGILKDIYRCYDYNGCRTYMMGDNSKGLPEIEISYDLFMKARKEYFVSKNIKGIDYNK